jgi:hypothetical protein
VAIVDELAHTNAPFATRLVHCSPYIRDWIAKELVRDTWTFEEN